MKLTEIERRWARAALDSMFPCGGDPRLPIGISDLDVDGYLDDLGRCWPAMVFFVFRLALVVIGLAPLVLLRRLCTFHRLGSEDRLRVLEKLYASRIYFVRQLVTLVKATGGLLYGGSARVRAAIAPGNNASAERWVRLRRNEASVS